MQVNSTECYNTTAIEREYLTNNMGNTWTIYRQANKGNNTPVDTINETKVL